MARKKTFVLLLLIVALGIFLRTANIDTAPPGIYPDEAVNGMNAYDAQETGSYQWFYPDNNGREGLYINLIAFAFKFFGVGFLTLKLASIIFGVLTIIGTYLLAKEIFGKRVGIISAFLVSSSFWAINFSRIAFRAVMLPAVLVFSFYFLFRGLRTKKWYDFALSGLIFGLGLHTYIAWRIAPLIVIVVLFAYMLTKEKFLKDYWKHIVVFGFSSFLSAFPMLYTFYAHPELMESRSASISIMSPEVNRGNLPKTFLRSFSLSLVKYNFWGDQNWRHNYPPYPLLDPAAGTAFLFGIIYSIWKFFALGYSRFKEKIRDSRFPTHAFLLSWFFLMLAPEAMTGEGLPHALRAIGTLPIVFIFSALTFDFLRRKSKEHTPLFQKLSVFLTVLILISIGLFNSAKYHFFWAEKMETARAFEKSLVDIADYAKTLPPGRKKYVIAGPMQRIPVKLLNTDASNLSFVYPEEIDNIRPINDNFEIIMTEKNDKIISKLQSRFDNLDLEEKKDDKGMSYYVLK